MTIPDYISPIVAYRVWRWDAAGLKSLNGEPWRPGRPFAAECRALGCRDAPQFNCGCGVYGARSLDHLRKTGYDRYGIHGEVSLWGSVLEHERGWRAQYAYPKDLVLPLEMVPLGMGRAESWLAALAAYGCDVSVSGKDGIVPLWTKFSGYDRAGLDLLVRRCREWYARREQERTIKPGDRVAVLRRGIGVVEQVDGSWIQAVLWNRSVLKIRRKEIVWDEPNVRWEANHSDVFSATPPATSTAPTNQNRRNDKWTTSTTKARR